jgi:hypothetical protein
MMIFPEVKRKEKERYRLCVVGRVRVNHKRLSTYGVYGYRMCAYVHDILLLAFGTFGRNRPPMKTRIYFCTYIQYATYNIH